MVRQLMQSWLIAKEQEKTANEARLAIEVELYKAVMATQEIKKEGVTSVNADGLKATITSGYTYNVDQLLASENPELFNVKYEYSAKKAKDLSEEALSILQHITTCKPRKPSFSVSVL